MPERPQPFADGANEDALLPITAAVDRDRRSTRPDAGGSPSFLWFPSLDAVKKGTRLPAGTGELETLNSWNPEATTGGTRPARRLTFCPGGDKK
jgi:hypothetical protein